MIFFSSRAIWAKVRGILKIFQNYKFSSQMLTWQKQQLTGNNEITRFRNSFSRWHFVRSEMFDERRTFSIMSSVRILTTAFTLNWAPWKGTIFFGLKIWKSLHLVVELEIALLAVNCTFEVCPYGPMGPILFNPKIIWWVF